MTNHSFTGEKSPHLSSEQDAIFNQFNPNIAATILNQGLDLPIIELFVKYAPVAIAVFDCDMRYLLISQRWRDDYGLGEQNVIGKSHYKIFPEISQTWKDIHQECLQGNARKCEEDFWVRENGSLEWVSWEIIPWYKTDGKVGGIVMFTENKTQSKRLQQHLSIQYALTSIFAEATDLEEVSQKLLEEICLKLDWDLGELWVYNPQTCELDYETSWNKLHPELTEFLDLTKDIKFTPGFGLPGRAFSQGEPIWVNDVCEDGAFFRRQIARRTGLHSAFAFPIICSNKEAIAVITLFCREQRVEDPYLLKIMTNAGLQLGQFMERKQAEVALKNLNQLLEIKITERTNALRENEMQLTRLADNVPGMIYQFRMSADGIFSMPYVSSGCSNIYEIDPKEVKGNAQFLTNLIHSDDLEIVLQSITKSAQTLEPWEIEHRIITPSGQEKWVKGVSKPILQPDNSILWDGCILDITERKHAEIALSQLNEQLEHQVELRTKELYQTQSKFKRIVDNVPGMIYQFRLDAEGNQSFSYVSSGCRDIFEIEPEELIGDSTLAFSMIIPEDIDRLQKSIIISAQNLDKWELEYRIFTPSGKFKWVRGISNPQKQPDNSIIWDGCVFNITKSKQIELDFLESQQRLQTVISSSQIILFALDKEGVFTFSDGLGLKALGLKPGEIVGFSVYEIYQNFPEIIEHIQRGLNGEDFVSLIELNNFYLETRYTPILNNQKEVTGLIGVVVDVTEQKKSEIQLQQQKQYLQEALQELKQTQSQLIQSEKMSSLGQMVAGVAHEINNPTNFIHGNLTPACDYTHDLLELIDLYRKNYPEPPIEIQSKIDEIDLDFIQHDLVKLLNSMQEGTRRIREIVVSLRNFSRLDEADFKIADIHEGIESSLLILHNRLKPKADHLGVSVIKQYGQIPLVECYPGQLNQVFMNLLANAIDALENIEYPCITITTKLVTDNYIQIIIADNGVGIPQEIIPKLFDPFFTTKEVGKGTGLGLSISYQIIVDKHAGKFVCESIPGMTKFIIEIPVKNLIKLSK